MLYGLIPWAQNYNASLKKMKALFLSFSLDTCTGLIDTDH